MEEALVMADAFRIAFEQQLRRGSEHVLHLAETDTYKTLKKHRGTYSIHESQSLQLTTNIMKIICLFSLMALF